MWSHTRSAVWTTHSLKPKERGREAATASMPARTLSPLGCHSAASWDYVCRPLTCILFMASRSWSNWWAELSASRRMSVSFISLSLSSFRSCMTVSASLSIHSEILGKEGDTDGTSSEVTHLSL